MAECQYAENVAERTREVVFTDLAEYALLWGMRKHETQLLWIAEKALTQPMPAGNQNVPFVVMMSCPFNQNVHL
jgi:hypothetical protein